MAASLIARWAGLNQNSRRPVRYGAVSFCGFRGSGNKSALEFEGIMSLAKALVSPLRVKLRNTQHEQMSSALTPTTDIGLVARKHCADRPLWNISGAGAQTDKKITDCLSVRTGQMTGAPLSPSTGLGSEKSTFAALLSRYWGCEGVFGTARGLRSCFTFRGSDLRMQTNQPSGN